MTLTITIATDNAAFEDDNLRHECARILREAANNLEGTALVMFRLRDINGNRVGWLQLEDGHND